MNSTRTNMIFVMSIMSR